ncbi:MAG: hypothetical protein LBI13_06490 [Streptococcaceae bacterium]|jgi:hypothetical protein|nr:hypothetical protein [Streptococcaceae bacterium]
MSKSSGTAAGAVGLIAGVIITLVFGFKKATVYGVSVGSIFSPQSGATKAVGTVSNLLKDLGGSSAANSLSSVTDAAAASARNTNMPGVIIGIVIAVVGAILLVVSSRKKS